MTSLRTGHVSDDVLAARADGASTDDVVTAHLEACPACSARAQSFVQLRTALGRERPTDAATAAAVLARLDDAPRDRRALAVGVGGLLAAAAVAFVVVQAPDAGLVARGAGAPASVALMLQRQVGGTVAPVVDGDRLRGDEGLALAAGLHVLPARGAPRFAVVYARDAQQRVTWLRPAWPVGRDAPACERLPEGPAVLAPTLGASLDVVAGSLEVGLLVLEGTCDVAALDAELERGAQLSPSGQPPLVESALLHVVVE